MGFPGSDHSRVRPELPRLALKCTKMLSVHSGTLSELQNDSPQIASKPKSFSKKCLSLQLSRVQPAAPLEKLLSVAFIVTHVVALGR